MPQSERVEPARSAIEHVGRRAAARGATPDQAAFREELLARGLLIDSGVPGLYGRGGVFEDILGRFDALVR